MSYYSRLSKSFEGALRLPLTERSKYVFISDCHRGVGNSNDNFLKNQNLYYAALQHYYRLGYTYIELGDGDELWENRSMKQIMEAHGNVFLLLSRFHEQHRLYMLYGNHDMVKRTVGIRKNIAEAAAASWIILFIRNRKFLSLIYPFIPASYWKPISPWMFTSLTDIRQICLILPCGGYPAFLSVTYGNLWSISAFSILPAQLKIIRENTKQNNGSIIGLNRRTIS